MKVDIKFMPEFIKTAIDNEVARATEIELENAKKRIDERKAEIIAGVILYVQKEMLVESTGEHIKITIRTI